MQKDIPMSEEEVHYNQRGVELVLTGCANHLCHIREGHQFEVLNISIWPVQVVKSCDAK